MLWGYLSDVVDHIVGKYSVSDDFRSLLRHYNLSRKDGDVIRDNLFAYDLVIPEDKNKNILYEIWAIEEFKNLFINYFKKKYPSREMNLDYLNRYKINDEFLKERSEVSNVNAILEDYMGKDKLSYQYLKDLSEYNLLSSYFEITVKLLSTPLNVYENIFTIREYTLDYLKEISRKNKLDTEYPQTIEEVLDFIIINSNKELIESIYNHDAFNYKDNDLNNIVKFISYGFNLKNKPNLMMECFNSKYNDLKYSYTIKDYDPKKDEVIFYLSDDEEDKKSKPICLDYEDFSNYKFGALSSSWFDAIIILNELREKIQKDYDNIIKTNFKDKLIKTKYSYYILDEIDEYSLTFLENLFSKEKYDDLISYYNLSEENGIEIKDACYVYCFEYKNYESELIRDYHIIKMFDLEFREHYEFLLDEDKKDLDKFFDYTNYKKLDELTKDYQMRNYFKYNLKDEELCEFLYNELSERNLLDYWDCMDLYENGASLDSKQKIKEYLDEFEGSYDFSRPQSIMESNMYLIENTSREFIDKVYNSDRNYVTGLHFTLGMYIRNEFGLNDRSNSKLLNDICESKYHCIASFGADGDSAVILKEFYDYVHKNYDEIISNTTFKNTIDMGKYILS